MWRFVGFDLTETNNAAENIVRHVLISFLANFLPSKNERVGRSFFLAPR